MRRTNLDTGLIQYAPCVAPYAQFPFESDMVVLDHEEDNGAIEMGVSDALRKAHEIVSDTRRRMRSGARLACYGWPFPRDVSQATAFAPLFAGLLRKADYLAPCCYAASADEEPDAIVRRGALYSECVARMPREVWAKRRFGVVSDFPLDSGSPCSERQVRAQCLAARVAGCDSLYVWSGLPHRVWQATRVSVDPQVRSAIRAARLMLDEKWGFDMAGRHGDPDAWTNDDIQRRYAAVAKRIARMFMNAWREALAGVG